MSRIQEFFDQRFKDIEKVNDEDFNLFIDLCFFMAYFYFNNNYYYEDKWIDTLYQTKKI